MPGRLLRRAALTSLVLLCVAVESPPRVRAAQADPPETMHGVYRYRVRGLTAGAGLFSFMLFKAGGMYHAAAHRMLPGFFKILSGMAKVSNDPSTKEMHDFFRSGDLYGLDLSTIPVTAGFGVEIEFTLELVKKEWQLKRGSYRWSSDHHFSFSAGERSLLENVRGQGSGVLDPKTSSITLVTTGKKGSRRLELLGEVPITGGQTAGKSVFTNGPIRWSFDHGTGEMEMVMGALASHRQKMEGADNQPVVGHISISTSGSPSRGGPPGRVMKDSTVYQDLLDSGVVEELEIWGECAAAIRSPRRNDELVYDDRKPGQLVDTAFAEVTPSFWEDDLHWEFEEIQGSKLDPPPEKANGNDFDIIYTNLPERNSAFKFGEVKARFDTDRAKRAGCKDPEPREVGYFFDRDGVNHGGPSGPRPDKAPPASKPNPNWFHYWMQTKANPGLPINFVRYGGEGGGCGDENGYFLKGDKYIVLCDGAQTIGYNVLAPLNMPEGIDNFAATLLHENQHHDNYWEFWPAGYGTPANPNFDLRDLDRDDIPDLRESKLAVPPQVKSRTHRTKFSPRARDSFGLKITDEHVLAYAAEFRWKMGSAKKEDWSCPGQQTRICGL